MSAFVCNKVTFDRIVTYVFANRLDFNWLIRKHGTVQQMGQVLVNENYRSVNERYNDSDIPFEYQYTYKPESLLQVLKSVNCLDYQSCETDNWNQTDAYEILDHVKDSILQNLIQQTGKKREYELAEWG